jgi:Zn-finger nucleic acid-binding protein
MRITTSAGGVIIDRCPECSGIWLDGGEVTRMDPAGGARAEGLEFRVTEAQRQADDEQIADQQETFQAKASEAQPGEWLFQFLVGLPREVYSPVRIAACVLVFVVELISTTLAVSTQTALPMQPLTHGGVALTYCLECKGLWFEGEEVARVIGAALAHMASMPGSAQPMLGASGAISAVLGAYAVLFPHRKLYMNLFIMMRRVPAVLYVAIWLALQFYFVSQGAPGVAWWAHIGGVAVGVALAAVHRAVRAHRLLAAQGA